MKLFKVGLSILLSIAVFTGCGMDKPASVNGNSSESVNNSNKVEKNKWPQQPVTILVPFAAGGGTDAVARALANSTEKYLGQPIVIINKTGGGGAVGLTEGSAAKPDGYNVTMITREIVTLPINGLCSVTADDFELICNINLDPGLVTVAENSPYMTIKELISAAKEQPSAIKFASTATPNLYAYTLQLDQDITFNHIPFNGAAEAVPAVLGNHADFTITSPGEVLSQVQGGQLRALAVMSEERLASLPDVPTMKENGIDIVTGTWRGLAVPKDTPQDVVKVLQEAFAQGVEDAEFVDFMNKAALNINYLEADSFADFIADDTTVATEIFDSLE